MDGPGSEDLLQDIENSRKKFKISEQVLPDGGHDARGSKVENLCAECYDSSNKRGEKTRSICVLHVGWTEDSGLENLQHVLAVHGKRDGCTGTIDRRRAELSRFPDKSVFWSWNVLKERQNVPSVRDLLTESRTSAEFLQKLENISREDVESIERLTRGQSENRRWFDYRKYIITGSAAHTLMNAVRRQRCNYRTFGLISKEISKYLPYPAVVYGRAKEHVARAEFLARKGKELTDFKFEGRGIQLHEQFKFLGASVDGLYSYSKGAGDKVFELLEIKTPYSLRCMKVHEDGARLSYLDKDLNLKHGCQIFVQIQFYLEIYNLESCILLVWTPNDYLELNIRRDRTFCDAMIRDLCLLYKEIFVPRLFNDGKRKIE